MDKKIENMSLQEIKNAVMEGLSFLPTDEIKEQVFMGVMISMIM